MNLSAWKDRLATGEYDAPLAALYGAAGAPRARYARLCDEYLRTFGDAPDALLISAPGRTELAGNHTDHQLGIVLCAAVTLDTAAAAASAADNAVAQTLSGGNQQKVVLAKWLLANPKVLILDEPTRGIDVGAKHEIYCIMEEMVQSGISIILISSELPEFIGMCDRCYTMYGGKINGELIGSEMTQEAIMMKCAGGM